MHQIFFSATDYEHTRIGHMHLAGEQITTPFLYPVASLITGTTPRGGGIWKYVLQAHTHGLMRRNKPLINQVLHFLDFSISPTSLHKWRTQPLRGHYNEAFLDLNYQAPLFMDSGGFKLLWSNELDLSTYGIQATPETILALQRDFGSNIIATLDYPLPPGLQRAEAEERMVKSQENAISTLQLLQGMPDYDPFVFAAVHGQNSEDIRHYVENLFTKIDEIGFDVPLGIAIGSLVPLRGAQKIQSIIEIVKGAIAGIPEPRKRFTPVHIFGVTGNLIPLLAYLGIDTFDSSTYVQMARNLRYFEPSTQRFVPVLEMESLKCSCCVCRDTNLPELQEGLTAKTQPCKPLSNGYYKSKYYADIALHNLEMDYKTVQETQQAIEADSIREYLIVHTENFPRLREPLNILASEDHALNARLSRTSHVVIKPKEPISLKNTISLKYTPDSFNIVSNGYQPPTAKSILLIIPCSGGKPYSISRSHKLINERLSKVLGNKVTLIHKVTLSGLYGPVPEEHENEPEILNYDFRLDPINEAQIILVANRLQIYLERFGKDYAACISYATSHAYRSVLERVAKQIGYLQILPAKPKSRRLTEFFRGENIEQLAECVSNILNPLET